MMLLAGVCCLLAACQSKEELQEVNPESNAPMFWRHPSLQGE